MSHGKALSTSDKIKASASRAPRAVAPLDGRTKTARFLRQATDRLLDHLPRPTFAQITIARTAAAKIYRLDKLEAELSESDMSAFDDHRWMQWMGSLERSLEALGLTQREGRGFREPGKRGDAGRPAPNRDGGTLANYAAQRSAGAAA